MIAHLLAKELRAQRGAVFGSALVSFVLAGITLLGDARDRQLMTPLGALEPVLFAGVPLAAMVLTYTTFTRELRTRSVLFTEALPVTRGAVLAAKLLSLLLTLPATLVPAVLLVSSRAADLAEGAASEAALRVACGTWATLGVITLSAVLGRYRFPFYMALVATAALYDISGGDSRQFGPFAAVSGLGVEGEALSARAAVESAAVGAAALLVAATMFIVREGSVAVLLGERMGHAEKVVTAAVLLLGTFAASVLIEPKEKEPYTLREEGAVVRRGQRVRLTVGPSTATASTAESLAAALTPALDDAAVWLRMTHVAPVFLVHRDDLDPQRFERATLAKRDGVLVRANFRALADRDDLATFLVQELLDGHTRGRARYEPRMWVRDGGALFAVSRAMTSARRDRLLLRALYARRAGWTFADLGRWHTVRDRTSPELSDALAWSVLDALAAARGEESVARLLREVLVRPEGNDARVLFGATSGPATDRLPLTAGIAVAELQALWDAHLEAASARLGERLAALPELTLDVAVQSPSERLRTLGVSVRASRPGSRWASVLYRGLSPLDTDVQRSGMQRAAVDPTRTSSVAIPWVFAPRSTVYVAAALYVPELACEVLAGAARVALP